MMNPILTEQENQAALKRLEEIFDAEPGTPEGDEAELLTQRIVEFESKAYPMGVSAQNLSYMLND